MTAANQLDSVKPLETEPLPLEQPVADPLREARDVIEGVGLDCLISPREYVDQSRVPLGGE